LKIVIVRDGEVGKTRILSTYTTGTFPKDYVPTVFDNKVVKLDYEGKEIKVSLWDTAGQEDFDRLRSLFYPGASAIIVCFSAVDIISAYNIRDRWLPEIKVHAANVPLVLVCTKIDLVNDMVLVNKLYEEGTTPISKEQGMALATEIGAAEYIEVSAFTGINIDQPFIKASEVAMKRLSKLAESSTLTNSTKSTIVKPTEKNKSGCTLL